MFVTHLLAQAAAVDAYAFTTGRLAGSVAALIGLAGVVIGGWALARAAGRLGGGRRGAIVALVAGPVGLVLGGVVVATADGGPGTGGGIVGGFAALAFGLVATVLGRQARARSRH